MPITMPVLITSGRRYSMDGERGQKLEGVSINYLAGSSADDTEFIGLEPSKDSLPYDQWNMVRVNGLGYYLAEFDMVTGKSSRGNAQKVLKPVKLVSFLGAWQFAPPAAKGAS